MAWVRIDDQAPRNEKMLKAGPAACWLWVCGIAHCQSQLTDGFISMDVLPMIGVTGAPRAKKLADALVAAGLFDRADGGYAVHDYLDFNPSRAVVLKKRADDAARKRASESGANPNGIQADSGAPRAGVPSHPIRSHPESKTRASEASPSPAETVVEAYRAAWQLAYGYECSLMLSAIEFMNVEQQLAKCPTERLTAAVGAYFATKDDYIRNAKHPLALFLKDPMKYLAGPAAVPRTTPRGCGHRPPCVDDAAHTSRDLADRRRVS